MLIVTGPSCSGKTTFGRIARARGFSVRETTDVVKQAFEATGLRGEDIVEFCVRRYRESGEEVFAAENYDRIKRESGGVNHLLLVGLRAAGEVEFFKRTVPGTTAIGVYADTTVRFERGLLRDRSDCAQTLEEFMRRDMREYAMGLAALFSRTLDVLIFNNGTMAAFEERCQTELTSAG